MSFASNNKYAVCLSGALSMLPVSNPPARATELNAYIAGVVEGVAFGRYLAGGKKVEILNCIYDWFAGKPSAYDTIYAAFGRYGDFTPGAIIWELSKKKCGD